MAPVHEGIELIVETRRDPRFGLSCSSASALSWLGATCGEFEELEIDSLLVTPAGAVALDARAVPRHV
jgi:hypothetical protein